MLGRRLLALLVAVLCIVVRIGMETSEASANSANEVKALAGPGVVCRTSADAEPERQPAEAPDGFDDPRRASGPLARMAPHGLRWAVGAAATAGEREGDPKASRGPPSFVVC